MSLDMYRLSLEERNRRYKNIRKLMDEQGLDGLHHDSKMLMMTEVVS